MHRPLSIITLFLYAFFIPVYIVEGSARKLTITFNEHCDIPECMPQNETSNTFNLAHITAVGELDTLHYLWSSIGGPTILMALTDLDAQLKINWTQFLQSEDVSNSISFTLSPKYTVAVAVPKLIEFNDTKDTADVSNPSNNVTKLISLDLVDWRNFNTTMNHDTWSGTFQSIDPSTNATIAIKMAAFNQSARAESLPHLQHTENMTQFDLIISNLVTHFTNSRFAATLLFVSEGKITKEVKKSIDDEYTPAIFSIINLLLPPLSGSFTQWKPVVYTNEIRSMSDALQCHETNVESYNESSIVPRSLIRAFFDMSRVTVSSVRITFGSSGDKFYANTNYVSWSATVGYGKPPVEELSQLVIILISAGLGTPVLICIVGTIYTCFRKHKINKLAQLNESRYPPVTSTVN